MIRVGCCGFPEARAKYYRDFDVVEVQQTFYQPPLRVATSGKWRAGAPQGFEYAMKAWQLITHPPTSPTYRRLASPIPREKSSRYGFFRPTDEVWGAWETTRSHAEAMGARIIVFQCPASFTRTAENIGNLKAFFSRVKRDGFIFVWEPRGPWVREDVEPVCGEAGLIPCIDPFSEDFYAPPSLMYLRLHGRSGYDYKFTDRDLSVIRGLAERHGEAYVMFNNVYMLEDARRFKAS